MRPVRLDLEGFTSFRGKTVLDFARLDLFAITGPTGAGKSSLIDAMLYALYGRTPRIGERSAAELISQGAPRLTVGLEFLVGGRKYRVVRTLPRGGHAQLSLERDAGTDQWEILAGKAAGAKEKVAEILGLDFDGFTKSVVLPQGQFDRFLRGKPDERREILKELLSLDVYSEMMQRANQISTAAAAECGAHQQVLDSSYAGATEENKAAAELDLDRLGRETIAVTSARDRVTELLPLAGELRHERQARDLAAQEEEAARTALAAAAESSRLAQEEILKRTEALDAIEKALAQAGYDEKLHHELLSLEPLARQREEARQALPYRCRELAQGTLRQTTLERNESQSTQQWRQATATFTAATSRLEAAAKQDEAARRKYGSPDAVRQLASNFDEARKKHLRQKEELELRLDGLRGESDAARKAVTQLRRKLKAAEAAQAAALQALDHLKHLHAAADLRRHLRKGAACPVCAQIVGRLPKADRLAALEAAEAELARKQQDRDRTTKDLAQQEERVDAAPAQIAAIEDHLKQNNDALAAGRDKARRILGRDGGAEAGSLLHALADRIAALEADHAQARQEAARAQTAESTARDDAQKQSHALELCRRELAQTERDIQETRTRLEQWEEQLGAWGDLRVIQEQLAAMKESRRRRDDCLRRKESEEPLRQAAQVRRASAEAEATAHRGRIETLGARISRAHDRILVLGQELAASPADIPEIAGADEVARLERRRSQIEAHASDLRRDTALAAERILALARQIEEADAKRAQIEALRARAAVFKDLASALRADQFLRFLLEEALRRLADGGTTHLLTLSSGRYSFSSRDDEFFVIDHWNADDTRSVNTLSGGESFLASLALALALADSLSELASQSPSQRPSLRLETLILDEGFSTLDAEALDVVLQGIEALASQDRMVGVISHVPELAERFPNRIRVHKGVGGSSIEVL